MRGKEVLCGLSDKDHGITPAYAGKRGLPHGADFVSGDHPRLCGEKVVSLPVRLLTWGSPPPMRGKAAISRRRMSRIRITPAYAGKRQLLFDARRFFRDHPRLCGEKIQPVHL